MDLNDIKRGLRAEIKKRENEQYLTFQCNVRQMCKDVLAKLEEQESEIAKLKESVKGLILDNYLKDKELRHQKYKRCLAMARWCETRHFIIRYIQADKILNDENYIGTDDYLRREYMIKHYCRWANKWLELAEKFK